MNSQTLSKSHYYLFFYLLFGGLTLNAKGELFFSEYVEGTSNNKCIEIFNPTDQDIILTDVYRVIQYRNGSTTPKTLSNLRGIISAGETHVICDVSLGTYSDQLFTAGPTGNDAFTLEKKGVVVDLFGVIGCDPGDGWAVDGKNTTDVTLRRNSCITKGVTSSSGCVFPRAEDWTAYPVNTFSGLGKHDPGSAEVEIFGNNALCENAEVELVATEGFVQYRWSTGSSSPSIKVTSAGIYSVTVTTSLGCTVEETKIVNGTSPEIFATVSNITPASCRPKKDGSFRVNPSGGSGGFSYAWETGSGNSSLISGVGADTYNVTVTDDNGCSIAKEVIVGGAVTVPLAATIMGETCKGRHDATITLSTSVGSNLRYSIDGDNFDSKNYFTGLAPGDYLVQVIDDNGCGDAKNIKVEGGTRFTLSNSVIGQAQCQGEGNGGQIILVPEGGKKPYEVSFDGGPFTLQKVFSDLKGDTFDIVVRDDSGCEKAFKQIIEEGSDLEITGYELTLATCEGIDDGGINISTDKGSGNISYSMRNDNGIWIPNSNPNHWRGLPVGQHTVLVEDYAFGCRIPIDFEILEESPLLTNIINPTPCKDDQKGTITVLPQTGIAPYQYSLDTGIFVDTNFFLDLDPMATYVVITRDSIGCVKVDSVDFDAVVNFEIQLATPSTESCANYGDGQITVFTNSTNPVEYCLDDMAYRDNAVFSGLDPGDFTVYAKSGACTDSAMVTVLPATPIVLLDVEPQIALCEGGDGQLTISVSGGEEPYQYKLGDNPYQDSKVFANLMQGNYTLTVRDANLCEQTFTDVILAGPVRLDAECVVVQHVSTKGGRDGVAEVTVFGGASPYNVQLIDAGFNNIISTGFESFNNMPAGNYVVAISDFNDCTTTCSFTINEPQCDFSIEHTKSDATCFEATDGTISLVLPTENTPFMFNWSDVQYNGQEQLTGLAEGAYSVTVTDQAGCKDSLIISIVAPPLLSVEIIADNTTICEKDTALLSVTNSYAQYNWSNMATDATAKVYETGIYQVTVRNVDGCVATDDIVINVIAQDTIRDTRFTCDESSVGTFVTEDRGLDGCMDIVFRTFELARRDTTFLTTTTCNPTEAGVARNRYSNTFGCDSLVMITTSLLRSDTTYQTEMSCNSAELGIRRVVLPNAVGCDSMLVIETVLDESVEKSFLTAFTCNPIEVGTDTVFAMTFAGCDSLIITQTISNASTPTNLTATTCITTAVSIDTLFLTNQFLCDSLVVINTTMVPSDFVPLMQQSCNPLDTGLVRQNLINQYGCDSTVETHTTLMPINECQLGFSLVADTICWDASLGDIQLTITEGNPPFNYHILNDFWRDTVQRGIILTTDAETILTNIPVGQYAIVLVNDRNVKSEERIALTQAKEIIVDGLFSDYAGFAVSCEGESDGSIDLNITNGQAPYTYLWADGTEGENLQNVAEGTYQVTVTDANGCQEAATFDLLSSLEMQIDFQAFSPKCFGDVAGRITIYDLPNANGTVEYSLDGVFFQPISALPFTIEDLLPKDEYQLFIQDENDCQANTFFSVPVATDYQLTLGDSKNIILGDSLTLTPEANFEIERFEWSATVPLTCENCLELKTIPTQNGAYTLTAYDANGCKATASTTVNLRKESQVYLPNAFSPNGDGNNDVYQVLTGNIVKSIKSMRIFDYEGRLMYQVTNYPPNDASVGWDGLFNGQKMLPGVFVVFVEVELLDGESKRYRQTMTLVK